LIPTKISSLFWCGVGVTELVGGWVHVGGTMIQGNYVCPTATPIPTLIHPPTPTP